MTLIIAGDIGGTKTILRLVEVKEEKKSFQTLAEANYVSADYPDLVPIVKEFWQTTQKQKLPQKACFAIAGPVLNNTSNLTNLNWYLDSYRLAEDLGIESVTLINDFAAVSYGILGLDLGQIKTLQPGKPQENAPIGIIGAGTGLGEAFLIPNSSGAQIFPTEGGHTDFAPRSQLEFQLLSYLQEKYHLDRVSVERVVSGQGIVAIYQFLRDQKFVSETPEIARVIQAWEQGKQLPKNIDPAATIAIAAMKKSDSLCEKTMTLFISAYGAEAGNLALKLLPYGGIYIAGGIAAKIMPLMESSLFLEAFKHKGRVSAAIEQIPVHIVLNPQVGLLGSVSYALAH
ncbi:MAG: glucokinase [Spirulinaceae cyanobacterium]